MPELLKNRYNDESLYELALSIRAVYPSFRVKDFLNGIMDETWEGLELKAYTKKHSFADASTRTHYPGTHSVTLIVNGAGRGTLDFEVTAGQRGPHQGKRA